MSSAVVRSGFSEDSSLLLSGAYYVLFRFGDGSCKVIYTSLNKELVDDNVKKGYLFDILTQRMFPLSRVEGASLEIYETEPPMSEVDKFANRYIS